MKQSIALNILQSGHNVFITGSAGTGKTHLLRQYIQYLHERKVYPTIVAPTGIAASHLKGQTIHSFFALGIRDGVVDNGFVEGLLEKRYLKTRFSKLKILIIDEISMVSPELFASMDKILRAFKNSPDPFGGVQVVISGDFFQLPPVSREPKAKRFAWQAEVWKALELKSCYLQEKFRQDDMRLITLLDEIRSATVSQESHMLLQSRMHMSLDIEFSPTKLYTHNVDVDRINQNELDTLPSKPQLYVYSSKGSTKNIEKIFKTSLVLEELTLKKDAIVLFIKNNPEKGYVNGTTGIVVDFEHGIPIVRTTEGSTIRVVAEDWSIENDKGESIATISQIPLRLAWAMTIHKSQGMTLDAAEIDLSKTFEVGQGYVALSRIKSIDGLRLMGINDMALSIEPLSLRIDNPIKEASMRAENEIASYSQERLDKESTRYIESLGGITSFVQIEQERKIIRAGKVKQGDDTPTHIKTKALIESSNTIKEIATARAMTEGTIISHLAKCIEEEPDIDIEKFRPTTEKFLDIKAKYIEIKEDNNPDNLTEDGRVRLKPLFDAFDGEVSYDLLRLCMLFV